MNWIFQQSINVNINSLDYSWKNSRANMMESWGPVAGKDSGIHWGAVCGPRSSESVDVPLVKIRLGIRSRFCVWMGSSKDVWRIWKLWFVLKGGLGLHFLSVLESVNTFNRLLLHQTWQQLFELPNASFPFFGFLKPPFRPSSPQNTFIIKFQNKSIH